MTDQPGRADPVPDEPSGDPWRAFGWVVAGVAFYGFLGWLVDKWQGTTGWVAVGIIVGAGFGLYRTWAEFGRATSEPIEGAKSADEIDEEERDEW
jgi:ATP synthase protein I